MLEHKNNKAIKTTSVEDLLRVKIHEKPNEAFWEHFDRSLNEKMKKSLVKSPSRFSLEYLSKAFAFYLKPSSILAGAALFTVGFFAFASMSQIREVSTINPFFKNPASAVLLSQKTSKEGVKNYIRDAVNTWPQTSISTNQSAQHENMLDINASNVRYLAGSSFNASAMPRNLY